MPGVMSNTRMIEMIAYAFAFMRMASKTVESVRFIALYQAEVWIPY
jgi:hypothetical protein